jgi:hypothetical protein
VRIDAVLDAPSDNVMKKETIIRKFLIVIGTENEEITRQTNKKNRVPLTSAR